MLIVIILNRSELLPVYLHFLKRRCCVSHVGEPKEMVLFGNLQTCKIRVELFKSVSLPFLLSAGNNA